MEINKPVIVDTDFLSHYLGARESAAKMMRVLLEKGYYPVTTVMTTAEMYYGACKKGWGEKRFTELEAALSGMVILPFDRKASLKYGQIRAGLVNTGRNIGFADTAIAAIALTKEIPVLTGNIDHFKRIEELEVIEHVF